MVPSDVHSILLDITWVEVVLSVLVSTFTFESTGKSITWNMAGVIYPTMSRESETPEMFLKVGLYSEGAKIK